MAEYKEKIISAADSVLDWLYPQNIYCLCCGDSMENSRIHGICDVCASRINWKTDNPFKRDMDQFAFDGVFMCCVYGFLPRRIMHRFKLSGNPYVARSIGRLMGDRLVMAMEDGLPEEAGTERGAEYRPDALIAVPMHREKLARRGFNQAELLAKYASRTSGIPHIPGFLIKTQKTASMRLSDGLSRRRSLLDGSFAVSPKYLDWICGKDLVLVDDVVTTGSTADACARLLKSCGAKSVEILCFAGSSGWHAQPEE